MVFYLLVFNSFCCVCLRDLNKVKNTSKLASTTANQHFRVIIRYLAVRIVLRTLLIRFVFKTSR